MTFQVLLSRLSEPIWHKSRVMTTFSRCVILCVDQLNMIVHTHHSRDCFAFIIQVKCMVINTLECMSLT